MKAAAEYYKIGIMKKYVIQPLRKTISDLRMKEHQADAHCLSQVKKINFKAFVRSLETIRFVRDQVEIKALDKAKDIYKFRLKQKVMKELRYNIIFSKKEVFHAQQKCQRAFVKSVFDQWNMRLTSLRFERNALDERDAAVVRRF